MAVHRRCRPDLGAVGHWLGLAEVSASDPLDGFRHGDEHALSRWLVGAAAGGDKATDDSVGHALGAASQLAEKGMSASDSLRKAIKEADTPEKVNGVVRGAMDKAQRATQARREQLGDFIGRHRRTLRSRRRPRGSQSPQGQVYIAHCVFDSAQAFNALGLFAAHLADAAKTCDGTQVGTQGANRTTPNKVCAINVAWVFSEFATLSSSLSLAIDACAKTLVPNPDALCAASVSELVTSVSTLAGGGAMMSAACNSRFVDQVPPELAVPSNVGSTVPFPERRLREQDSQADGGSAPARALLYGGGKGPQSALCYFQTTEILWALAQAALYITQSAEGSVGPIGKCPASNRVGGKRVKGGLYKEAEATCAYNIGGILASYGTILTLIQMAVVSCTDTLNLKAICGAGVTSVLTSFAEATQAGSGVYVACERLQDERMKAALQKAYFMEKVGGRDIATMLGGNGHGHLLGRRLGVDGGAGLVSDELKATYGTPEEALANITGLDLASVGLDGRPSNSPTAWKEGLAGDIAELVDARGEQGLGAEAARHSFCAA